MLYSHTNDRRVDKSNLAVVNRPPAASGVVNQPLKT
jgi:hypothetical protein